MISGPYITSIKNIDNNNARYDVMAKLNSGDWVKLQVPLFYNNTTSEFAVSAAPNFMEAPKTNPDIVRYDSIEDWNTTDAEATAMETVLSQYFKAWATSDLNIIRPFLSAEATPEARAGLNNSVSFVSVDGIQTRNPFTLADGSPDPDQRQVKINVKWNLPSSKEVVYSQSYDVRMFKESNKWVIVDIRSGQPNYTTAEAPTE